MQRLCSLHIICCVACLLLLQIFSEKIDSLAAALCDTDKVFPCPTLRSNLSAPFWGELECAASNSFVISNCSGGQPSWEGFDKAAQYDDGDGNHLGAPELIGLYKAGYTTYINLTWTLNETVNGRQCAGPIPFEDVDSFLPDVINLTSFANGSFQFSSNNAIFLFGCDVINLSDSDTLSVESDTCREYKQQCDIAMPCVQLKPFHELALHKTLQNLSCSHFKFLTTQQTSIPVSNWSNAAIQLIYGDIKCQACLESEGQCYFNKDTRSFEQCICGANSLSDTVCLNIDIDKDCTAFACNPGAQIGVAVGVTFAAFIVLALCCFLKPKWLDTLLKSVQTISKPSDPTLILDLEKLTEWPVEISYSSIVSATSSFNNVLGEGGFGVVYYGLLTEEAFEAAIKDDIQFIIDVIMGRTMPAKDKPAILLAEEWQHVRRALFVALWCIQDHPMSRPHMSEVVLYLEGKMAVDEHPPRPAIASILLSLSCQQWSHQCNDITPISGR
ncbi:hypothetical protein L7F22_012346 [Adiantum nelumboides]|nr:hypothetical protein [Adiantum nelumboides]